MATKAPKVKLGNRPAFIPRTIEAKMPDGTIGSIEVQYVYRTRTEFGAFIDQRMQAAQAESAAQQPPADDQSFSLAELQAKITAGNAQYLVDILHAWNLDAPLNVESAEQLCNELPAMAQAIIDGYRDAVIEGRLGN